MVGDMPIKNWDGVGYKEFPIESSSKGSDDNVIKYQKKRYSCQSCPLGCGGIIEIKKGKYKGEEGHKPEYETIGSFGGMLLQDDFDAIVEINEMCNRAAIDTISTGAVVAFATECFENGIIDTTTTGGLQLGWGKTEEVVQLVDLIIRREGFGDILADGVKRAAEKIGNGSEKYAVHAGGQELPMHDPRLDPGFAIAYECEPTPGRHTVSCYLYASLFGLEKRFPAAGRMVKSARGRAMKDVRRFAAGTYYMQLLNCGGMCLFGAITSQLPVVEYMNAVTGWGLSADDYLKTGERILNLRKAFNMREGIVYDGLQIHERAIGTTPLKEGPLKGKQVELAVLMDEFYQTVGWNRALGGPTPEKLEELGLASMGTGPVN
jgi:aldehyde:ferredoxin oxidoreductase